MLKSVANITHRFNHTKELEETTIYAIANVPNSITM